MECSYDACGSFNFELREDNGAAIDLTLGGIGNLEVQINFAKIFHEFFAVVKLEPAEGISNNGQGAKAFYKETLDSYPLIESIWYNAYSPITGPQQTDCMQQLVLDYNKTQYETAIKGGRRDTVETATVLNLPATITAASVGVWENLEESTVRRRPTAFASTALSPAKVSHNVHDAPPLQGVGKSVKKVHLPSPDTQQAPGKKSKLTTAKSATGAKKGGAGTNGNDASVGTDKMTTIKSHEGAGGSGSATGQKKATVEKQQSGGGGGGGGGSGGGVGGVRGITDNVRAPGSNQAVATHMYVLVYIKSLNNIIYVLILFPKLKITSLTFFSSFSILPFLQFWSNYSKYCYRY